MKKNQTIKFQQGMSFQALDSGGGRIYLKMRIFLSVFHGMKDRALPFERATYDTQFKAWCDLSRDMRGYKRCPSHWLKEKPDFDSLLKQFGLNETVHHRYRNK